MHTLSTLHLLWVSFLLYSWEQRRKIILQAKSTQHASPVPLSYQECKISLTGEKAEAFGQAPFSKCLVKALGFGNWGWSAPPRAQGHPQAVAPVRKGSWPQPCLCIIHLMNKRCCSLHSPPGSPELSNISFQETPVGLGRRKASYCWLPETYLEAFKKLITPQVTQLQHHLKVCDIFG